MRCLFFIQDFPITPDSVGGAPALSYSHLELLAHAHAEIHLVMLANPDKPLGFQEFTEKQPQVWRQVRGWCASFQTIKIKGIEKGRAPLKNFIQALRDPIEFACWDAQPNVLAEFKAIVAERQPDVIWAEHRIPAMVAQRAVKDVPIVYSFHDWEWQLGQLRYEAKSKAMDTAKKLRTRFGVWQTKRAEYATVTGVAGCVSGSVTETAEFKTLGARRVAYFPTTYEPITLPVVQESGLPVRVVHLGGMAGTRNQASVTRFLEAAWFPTSMKHETQPELWMVGSMKSAPDDFMAEMKRANAVCTGFVQDLSAVLRPHDIHIVPWELPSGTRTRIPVALNHAQALISTKAAAICLPELRHNENCILVDDLREMGYAINDLLSDPNKRKRLAEAGRNTFLQHFTRASVQPRFQRFVEELRQRPAVVA